MTYNVSSEEADRRDNRTRELKKSLSPGDTVKILIDFVVVGTQHDYIQVVHPGSVRNSERFMNLAWRGLEQITTCGKAVKDDFPAGSILLIDGDTYVRSAGWNRDSAAWTFTNTEYHETSGKPARYKLWQLVLPGESFKVIYIPESG